MARKIPVPSLLLRTTFLLSVLICSVIWAVPSAASAIGIALRDYVLIDGDEVTLGDVAELSGGDERQVKELRSIRLCSAPLPGRSRELDQPYIERRLVQSAVDLSRLSFSGAGKVIVQSAYAEITGTQIQAAVEEEVFRSLSREESATAPQRSQRKSKKKRGGGGSVHSVCSVAKSREDVTLEFRKLPQKVILPQGSVTLRAVPADDLPFKGNKVVYVEIFVEDKKTKRIPVSLKVRRFGEVLLCRRRVDRHHVFTAEDLIVERRETTTLPDDVDLEIGEVVGKRAKAFIPSGRVIRRGMIEQPPVLHRGDLVTVRVPLKGILVTMEGEARADGRPGEIIPVRNIRSRREISARVVDSKTVIVDSR